MIRAVIALLTALMLQGSPAAQAQRRAIVIGIGEYREVQSIVRPIGDARAVHARSPSCKRISTSGSGATTKTDPIRAAGVSAKPQCRPSLTQRRSQRKN